MNHKPLKMASKSWAVVYGDHLYFNFRYADEYYNPEVFGRLDIEGPYCVFLINDTTPKVIRRGAKVYEIGAFGATKNLAKEARKWGDNWIDANGKKVKILLINTLEREKYRNSTAKILKRSHLNKKLGLKLTDEELENMSLERCLALIKGRNKEIKWNQDKWR